MSRDFNPTLRQKLGCWVHERWRAELVLRFPWLAENVGLIWQDLCNRHEKLAIDSATGARICLWQDSSPLTVSRVFPDVGRRLLRHCLKSWPVQFNFLDQPVTSETPDISVIIPIGGEERLPQFWMSLASLRAQKGAEFEIIVIEQSAAPVLNGQLPNDVCYRHIPLQDPAMGFNKSWSLNVGARLARGRRLLLLDADFVLPRQFLHESTLLIGEGIAARPVRFIFSLDRVSTFGMIENRDMLLEPKAVEVIQNAPNPILVDREAYWRAGGHDERYFGWGGEDVEFLDRLRLLEVHEGGSLPVLHLWHPPAPTRADGTRNRERHSVVMQIKPEDRVRRLCELHLGAAKPHATDADSCHSVSCLHTVGID